MPDAAPAVPSARPRRGASRLLRAGLAALVAAVLAVVAAPAPAPAARAAGGELRVTVFDDRVVDGVFSGTTRNVAGTSDAKRTSGFIYLRDAAGAWWAASADGAGDYVLPGMAAGPATVYAEVPGPGTRAAAQEAGTGAVLAQRSDIGFDSGVYRAPTGQDSPTELAAGARYAEAPVTIAADGAALGIAVSAIQVSATVAMDGNELVPVAGQATIELLANGSPVAAAEDASANFRTAADVFFPAGRIGIRPAPGQGLAVAAVTASTTNGPLSVRRDGGDYLVSTSDLPFAEGFVKFNVVLRPAGAGSASPSSSASATPSASAADGDPSASATPDAASAAAAPQAWDGWPWMAGGAVLLLGGAAAGVLAQRRRAARRAAEAAAAALPDISRFAPEGYRPETVDEARTAAADGGPWRATPAAPAADPAPGAAPSRQSLPRFGRSAELGERPALAPGGAPSTLPPRLRNAAEGDEADGRLPRR